VDARRPGYHVPKIMYGRMPISASRISATARLSRMEKFLKLQNIAFVLITFDPKLLKWSNGNYPGP